MRSIYLFLFFGITCFNLSCNSLDFQNGKNQEKIFFDFSISGDEESQNVLCLIKFRIGGPEGNTLLLDGAGKVELDGEIIKADSARFTGFYYEKVKTLNDFVGKHTIKFTTSRNKEFSQEFQFKPFSLSEELPGTVSRTPFIIQLKDMPAKETSMHIVMIDTAYATNDINEKIVIENGKVPVSEAMLSQLKNGPISIELTSEVTKYIFNQSAPSGKIIIRYGLKREFILTN